MKMGMNDGSLPRLGWHGDAGYVSQRLVGLGMWALGTCFVLGAKQLVLMALAP